jgi:Reverse transcriptase (RNA-dependent DNA polymerase)
MLISGQICININGIQTPYFRCKKGLKQDNLLSPFLFNLVADTLSKISDKKMQAGYFKGLGNFNNKSLLNLNFADDTLNFLQTNFRMIEALQLLLLGFENLSDLKINYTKSTLIPLNISNEEGVLYANILGCEMKREYISII